MVSLLSLYLLRAGYLLMAVVLCLVIWPMVLVHSSAFALSDGVRTALLAGLGVMALLGLRYPLQMLPILLFEFVWKAIFLVGFAWPLWSAHRIDDAVAADVNGCFLQAIIIPLIPWRTVFAHYVVRAGDRWR